MNKYLNTLLTAAVIALMSGCSSDSITDDEPEEQPFDNRIKIETSIDGMTRTAFDADGNQVFSRSDNAFFCYFTPGSEFNSTTAEIQLYSYFDGWTPRRDPLVWPDNVTPLNFVGLHNVANVQPDGKSYNTIIPDKQENFDYIAKNDVLVAYSGNVKPGTTVHLQFKHVLAKLQVNVRLSDEVKAAGKTAADIKGAVAHAYAYGIIDNSKIAEGIIKVTPNDAYQMENMVLRTKVAAKEGYDASYVSIMLPIKDMLKKIGVGVGADMYTFNSDNFIELLQNHCTQVNITVYEEGLKIDGITISPWIMNTPVDIVGGDIVEQTTL